jgi:hypothetical protein
MQHAGKEKQRQSYYCNDQCEYCSRCTIRQTHRQILDRCKTSSVEFTFMQQPVIACAEPSEKSSKTESDSKNQNADDHPYPILRKGGIRYKRVDVNSRYQSDARNEDPYRSANREYAHGQLRTLSQNTEAADSA